jgi:lysophospholipase L1-like esterase
LFCEFPSKFNCVLNSALTVYSSGDSYSTVGFWPGGDLPTPGSPLGNPALPGQTTANGLNWVGHLTSTLNTSQVLTYDFAVTGATVSKRIVDTYAQFCVDDQVAQYKEYVSKKISTDDTLVAVWIGINDLGEPFWKKTSPPVEKTLDRYFELLKILSETGLKKFALLTVPRKSSRYSCGAHTNHSSSILRPNPSHD